MVGITL